MPNLSPDTAAQLLFTGRDASLETEGGEPLPVRLIALEGDAISATAPRLRVAGGMSLVGRVMADDSTPYEVCLVVDEAAYHNHELATVRLRITSVGVDTSRRRRTPRVAVGGVAWLIAVNCLNIVDGDRVDGTMVDLSTAGIAFATSRSLKKGDRLELHGRFFAESITTEVRVQAVRPGASPGRSIVGCSFIAPGRDTLERIERILNPHSRARGGVDNGALRQALTHDEPSGWKRVFRRG